MRNRKLINVIIFPVFALLAFLLIYTNLRENLYAGQTTVVRGIVSDKQGNPLQDVKITFLDPSRGSKYNVKSNKKGEFVKVGISPSVYKIYVELEGYFPFNSQYRVQLGIQEEIKIFLVKIPPKIEEDKDYAEGIIFFKQKKYEEAIKSFKKTIEKFPEDINALYSLGVSYLRIGNPDMAISRLTKAIELNSEIIEFYLALGECYFNKGNSEKALEAFSEAIAVDPDNPKAFFNMGVIFYKNDRTVEAINTFKKSIELAPQFSSAHYQLGLAFVKTGEFKEAIKHFEEFLKLEPDSPEVSGVKEMIEKLKKK